MAYLNQAREQFDRAHSKAFWDQFLGGVQGREAQLLDFNEIAHHLSLKTAIYRGTQIIPIDHIVGSVGRYKDFTGAFLPVNEDMRERWQRVAMLYIDPASTGAPPIDVYKVGDAYFVRDGNHRVSVVSQMGLDTIEAYVWEYPQPVEGVDTNADIDTLLLENERREFLENTQLDRLRPRHGIRLTAPGGYLELLGQIAYYQNALSQIDGEPVSYEDAVTAWYDMLYETTVQLIKEEGVLELFPDRTPADFYVWTTRHQRELAERYGKRVAMRDAARDFPRTQKRGAARRLLDGAVELLRRRMAE
ncbi:MAG: transcriptional regulator [Anaerolineae bacterium]|nr:transcriptional regulator [Anaerolineae bacterium]